MTIWAKRRHETTEARSEWNNTKLRDSELRGLGGRKMILKMLGF
jgi:hypothetical protein